MQLEKHQKKMRVGEMDLAVHVGSGDVAVLATPVMAALMEACAAESYKQFLQPGQTTVGIQLELKHIAATPLNMEITAYSQMIQKTEKVITFEIEVFDEKECIGTAIHKRAIVNKENFETRAAAKNSK